MATDFTQDANCQGAWLMKVDEDPLTDSSQNSNTGALKAAGEPNYLTNAPTGYDAGSYDFDGVDDKVNLSNDISLRVTVPFSVSAWIKLNNKDKFQGICHTSQGGGTNYYGMWFQITSGNLLSLNFGDSGLAASTARRSAVGNTVLTTGIWYHVVGVCNGATDFRLYVDGVRETETNSGSGGALANDANNHEIGSDGGAGLGDMIITELAIFDRVLTSTEINDIKDHGLDGTQRTGIMTTNKGYW